MLSLDQHQLQDSFWLQPVPVVSLAAFLTRVRSLLPCRWLRGPLLLDGTVSRDRTDSGTWSRSSSASNTKSTTSSASLLQHVLPDGFYPFNTGFASSWDHALQATISQRLHEDLQPLAALVREPLLIKPCRRQLHERQSYAWMALVFVKGKRFDPRDAETKW